MLDLIFYSIVEVLSGLAPNYETFLVLRLLFCRLDFLQDGRANGEAQTRIRDARPVEAREQVGDRNPDLRRGRGQLALCGAYIRSAPEQV